MQDQKISKQVVWPNPHTKIKNMIPCPGSNIRVNWLEEEIMGGGVESDALPLPVWLRNS